MQQPDWANGLPQEIWAIILSGEVKECNGTLSRAMLLRQVSKRIKAVVDNLLEFRKAVSVFFPSTAGVAAAWPLGKILRSVGKSCPNVADLAFWEGYYSVYQTGTGIGDDDLALIPTCFPGLTHLYVDYSGTAVTSDGIKSLAVLKNMQHFKFEVGTAMADDGFIHVIEAWAPTLTVIALTTGNSRIVWFRESFQFMTEPLSRAISKCTLLTTLELPYCNMTTSFLATILQSCGNTLVELDIEGNMYVNIQAALPSLMPCLTSLDAAYVGEHEGGITEEQAYHVLSVCPKLATFNAQGSQLSRAGRETLVEFARQKGCINTCFSLA
jgi:hypothetical protein